MPYIGKSPQFGVRNRFVYLITSSGATSVSGSDANGATLTFTDGAYVDVYLNGVLLKPTTDYNTSTANTIAGLAALSTNDEVTVIVYDVFAVGDTVSASSGGTFGGAVTFSGGIGGSLTVADGLTLTDGNVTVASGHGIDFSATSDLAGKSSELLDDYEEGTYTVTLTTATSGTITLKDTHNTGTYIKIGRIVIASCDARIHSTSSPQGNVHIGLPFAIASDGGSYLSSMVTHGVTIQTSQQGDFFIKGNDGQSYGNVHYNTSTNLGLQAENGGLGANDEFQFNLTYLTT